MRAALAGMLTALTAVTLAAVKPAVITPEEKAAARVIEADSLRADIRFLASDLLEGRGPGHPRRRVGPRVHPGSPRADRARAGSGERRLGAASRAGRRHGLPAARHPHHARGGEHRAALPRRLHRVLEHARGRDPRGLRDRVRGLRHHRARVRLGRLQGSGRAGQGPPRHEQRSGGRPRALCRQDPPLLRPLGLQVRPRGPPRRRRGHHHPYDGLGRLQMAGRPDLVDGRAVQPARRGGSAVAASEGLGHRGGVPAPHRPGGPRPGCPSRRRPEEGFPARAPRRPGQPDPRQRGAAQADRERHRPARGERQRAGRGGGALHGPPRSPRGEGGRPSPARTRSTTARSTTLPGSRPCSRSPRP